MTLAVAEALNHNNPNLKVQYRDNYAYIKPRY